MFMIVKNCNEASGKLKELFGKWDDVTRKILPQIFDEEATIGEIDFELTWDMDADFIMEGGVQEDEDGMKATFRLPFLLELLREKALKPSLEWILAIPHVRREYHSDLDERILEYVSDRRNHLNAVVLRTAYESFMDEFLKESALHASTCMSESVGDGIPMQVIQIPIQPDN